MSWTDAYLISFAIGGALAFVSLLGDLHIDLPGVDLDFHGFGDHGGHAGGGGAHASPLNLGTIAAFLVWFGATGYLLARYSSVWKLLAFGAALLAGLVGALLVFLFLAKFLMRPDEELDPADYEMVGVLGTVSSVIRADGFGEILFSQGGARRSASARSESGKTIPAGVEVVVTKYEDGVAWVTRWDELTGTGPANASAN